MTAVLKTRATPALVASSVVALALLSAAPAAADEPVRDERHDPSVYPPNGAQANMFIAGAVTTAVWYGTALSFSYLWPDAPGARDLRIPIAGPWMALADTGCADNDPGCSTFTVVLRAILTTIDAVGQVGGLAIIAEAALLKSAPPSGAAPAKHRPAKPVSLSQAPLVTGDVLGWSLIGRF